MVNILTKVKLVGRELSNNSNFRRHDEMIKNSKFKQSEYAH